MFNSFKKKSIMPVSEIISDLTNTIDRLLSAHQQNLDMAEFHEKESMKHDDAATSCHREAETARAISENLKKIVMVD